MQKASPSWQQQRKQASAPNQSNRQFGGQSNENGRVK